MPVTVISGFCSSNMGMSSFSKAFFKLLPPPPVSRCVCCHWLTLSLFPLLHWNSLPAFLLPEGQLPSYGSVFSFSFSSVLPSFFSHLPYPTSLIGRIQRRFPVKSGSRDPADPECTQALSHCLGTSRKIYDHRTFRITDTPRPAWPGWSLPWIYSE